MAFLSVWGVSRFSAPSARALIFAFVLLLAGTAHGRPLLHDYDLRAGELAAVVNALAEQSGVQILYDAKLVAGRKSAALFGRFTVAEALQRLLRGTGLEIASINANTYMVRAADKNPRTASTDSRSKIAPSRVEAHARLPSVYVTGANDLLPSALQTAMPVTRISREEIDASGYSTLFDLLRGQPGIQVSNQPEAMSPDSTSAYRTGASGAAAVELRRLGAKSTLFLIDGRRMAGYGLAPNSTGTVVDLSGIPLSMVERVEVMRDGAAVVYGADAIGGVINIVLRRDVSGRGLEIRSGVSSRGDAASQQMAAHWGQRFDNEARMLFGMNIAHSDPLQGSDRDWYSLDQRRQGLLDLRNVYSDPGNEMIYDESISSFVFRALHGCKPENINSEGACVQDSPKYTTLRTGKTEKSVFGRYDARIGDGMDAHLQVRFSDVLQRQQAIPSGVLFLFRVDERPQLWGVTHSFAEVGPVKEATHSRLASLATGLSGSIGDWRWDLRAGAEINRVDDRISGLIRSRGPDITLRQPMTGHQLGVDVTGAVSSSVQRSGRIFVQSLSLETSGFLFDLPGGTTSLTAGLEQRRDGIRQQPDALLRSGELLNQPAEMPVSAQKTAASGFVKFDLPVLRDLQADVAVRVERHEDFGTHASPYLGLRWNLDEALMLRASLSTGFRPPSLLELHQPERVNPDVFVEFHDSLGPCHVAVRKVEDWSLCMVQERFGNKRDLQAETSSTTAYGLVWSPTSRWTLMADVYRSVRKNEIGVIPEVYRVDPMLVFAGMLGRNAEGEIVDLNVGIANIGRSITHGVDVEVRNDTDLGNFGRLKATLGASYLLSLQKQLTPIDGFLESAGFADTPRFTAVANLRWNVRNWTAGANIRRTGGYGYAAYEGSAVVCPQYKQAIGKCSTPAFTLVNVNLAYHGAENWAASAGINNVFDHTPSYYDELSGGFNALYDDVVGRFFTFRFAYRF